MEMQPMPMSMPMANEHNTFWREDQVILTFHSSTHLFSTDGVNNRATILKELNLDARLHSLNQFLKDKKINYTLSFFEEEVKPQESHPTQESASSFEQQVSYFNPPPRIYLFGLSKPIQSDFGEVNTSIVTFFNFRKDTSFSNMADTASEADARSGIVKGDNDDGDKDQHSGKERVPVVRIVNQFNTGLGELNNRQVPISAASPVFLCGGTPYNSQGCPLTPPIPAENDSALWRFKLPKLTPDDLQEMTGKGVTVFILDTLPEFEVIEKAAKVAGYDNLLLLDVSKNVKFNYNVRLHPIVSPDGSEPVTVGKDVYGTHFRMIMPDHGLFIAGIVRDIVPDASVECIRVLNKYCVGDLDTLTQALQYIHDRMLLGGDLYQKPVVINMSLVLPTKEEAKSMGIDPDLGGPNNDMLTSVRQQIQSLVDLGAIIAASAGNEGDLRENQSGIRPDALYPAAFANPPDSIDGIIPVGAVDSNGQVTSYSCYPGPRGIATYGGEVPEVTPKYPNPNNPPIITGSDAVRGIYSSNDYPPLSVDSLISENVAPEVHAWAYWVGTSFATPIISAVAARVLELKSKGVPVSNVHDAVIAAAGTDMTNWDRLDPATPGSSGGSAYGPVILAMQQRQLVDEDDKKQEALTINYQFIRGKSSRVVKDVMDPSVRIEPGITKGDARQTLMQQNVPYGVLSNTEGKQFTILTMDQLSAPSLDEQVQVFAVNLPVFYVTIDPHDNLDDVLLTWATDFAANQNLIGMIVQEQNEILGVLPREKIEEHARSMSPGNFDLPQREGYTGYPVGRLEGASLSGNAYPGNPASRLPGVAFSGAALYTCPDCLRGLECPDGPEEREVRYYDPKHPPVCKWHKHLMLFKS